MSASSVRPYCIALAIAIQALLAGSASAICADVLFVRNDGSNGAGTQEDPVNVLPQFPSADFEVIYLFAGDGTVLNQDQGILLSTGQKLIGETIGYSDECNDIPANAAAALPFVTNVNSATPISLTDGNEVAGIRVLGVGFSGRAIEGIQIVGADIHDNVVEGGSISLSSSRGTMSIFDNEVRDSPSAAIDVRHEGDPMSLVIARNLIEDGDFEAISLNTFPFNGDFGSIVVDDNTIRRMGFTGIVVEQLSAEFLIEDNTVTDMPVGATAIVIRDSDGVGLIQRNVLTDIDNASLIVQLAGANTLDLTIDGNDVVDTRGVDVDNFGDGIAFHTSGPSSLVALVVNNTVDGRGDAGFEIDAQGSSGIAIRLDSNIVRDVQGLGIQLRSTAQAVLQAEIEGNDVDRSGGDGLNLLVSSSALLQSVAVRDNDIDDSGGRGIRASASGGPPLQLDLAVDDNRINGAAFEGLHLSSSTSGGGDLNFSVRSNSFVGNNDEGVYVDIRGSTQAAGHIEDNTFTANDEPFAIEAFSSGSSALCTVLANNQADSEHRLRGFPTSAHSYEDQLATNTGDVVLVDEGASTFAAVAIGSCDEVQLAVVPAPQQVTLVPEPAAREWAALAVLFGIARWRAAPRSSGRFAG